jgi:HMG (high mobility group) box
MSTPSPFLCFSYEFQRQYKKDVESGKESKKTSAELGQLIGDKWNRLSDDQKKPYIDESATTKGKFQVREAKQRPPKPSANLSYVSPAVTPGETKDHWG